MEASIAPLEVSAEHIQSDITDLKADVRELTRKVDSHFLITGGMIIGVALGLAGLMAKGFGWL